MTSTTSRPLVHFFSCFRLFVSCQEFDDALWYYGVLPPAGVPTELEVPDHNLQRPLLTSDALLWLFYSIDFIGFLPTWVDVFICKGYGGERKIGKPISYGHPWLVARSNVHALFTIPGIQAYILWRASLRLYGILVWVMSDEGLSYFDRYVVYAFLVAAFRCVVCAFWSPCVICILCVISVRNCLFSVFLFLFSAPWLV